MVLEDRTPLGVYLTNADLDRLASACSVMRFGSTSALYDSPFYVVIEGTIAVIDSDTGEELTTRSDGAFFTALTVFTTGTGATRSTHLVGKAAGRVLYVSSDTRLATFYGACSTEAREGYDTVVSTSLAAVLSTVSFVREAKLPNERLQRLVELCSYLSLPKHEHVWRKADPVHAFYIVLKGGAGVPMPAEGGLRVVASDFGELLGVASLVLDEPTRQYDVLTTERSLFIVVSRRSLQRFLEIDPGLQASLHYTTVRVLLMRQSKSLGSIFYAFDESELEKAARLARLQPTKPSEVICRKGEPPSALFVVAAGECDQDYEDGSAVRQLRVGSSFNELGLLLDNTVATVVASASAAHTMLLRISKADFEEVARSHRTMATPAHHAIVSRPTMPASLFGSSSTTACSSASGGSSSSGGGSGGSMPGSHDLLRRLRTVLLIKLEKDQVHLDVLLQHPDAHRALVAFLLPALRGGLRLTVYNEAITLLSRVRVAVLEAPRLQTSTVAEYDDFLFEQAHWFAFLLRLYPCRVSQDPERRMSHVLQDERRTGSQVQAALVRERMGPRLLELLARVCEAEVAARALLEASAQRSEAGRDTRGEAYSAKGPSGGAACSTATSSSSGGAASASAAAHDGSPPRPPSLKAVEASLVRLCELYSEMVQMGFVAFLELDAFAEMLEQMGAYHDSLKVLLVPSDASDSLSTMPPSRCVRLLLIQRILAPPVPALPFTGADQPARPRLPRQGRAVGRGRPRRRVPAAHATSRLARAAPGRAARVQEPACAQSL